ncbi:MAG: cell division topological specificity factor MinE [Helicobacteraceae bacterium]|jgi:cell division topological specificity factor MinE|nr:cell division topological specificity factor MinE [Helicobacteraceae bacterium]
MRLFGGLFGEQKSAAACARDRLRITLSRERAANDPSFAFLDQMKDEILAVVSKYKSIKNIEVSASKDQSAGRVEINIDLG